MTPSQTAPPVPGPTRTAARPAVPARHDAAAPVDSLLLTTTQISTYDGTRLLTRASGFFYARGERLFLVTSRHVLLDEATGHTPDRITIAVHAGGANLTSLVGYSILLYQDGTAVWRQARDGGGEVDVAVLEVSRKAFPAAAMIRAFTPEHMVQPGEPVRIGEQLLLVGFPLGFHDTVYHLPVVRHAIVASAFGVRFQGQGFFLTDARAHRGSSGAPLVMPCPDGDPALPWKLLGVHSSRMDMGSRDLVQDESLGLNCAWYADILNVLTEPAKA